MRQTAYSLARETSSIGTWGSESGDKLGPHRSSLYDMDLSHRRSGHRPGAVVARPPAAHNQL